MKKQRTIKYLLPVLLSFFVMGFVDLVGVATAYIKKDFELSDSVAQLLPGMVFIWFALLSIPTGLFQDRKGKKTTVNIGMTIMGLGLILPFIHYSYIMTLLSFVIIGIGNTILQVSANPLLIDISSDKGKAANLSLSQFIKAIASMLAPLITAGLATYTGNWKLIFPIYAAISFLTVLWLRSVKIEESKSDKEPATLKDVITIITKDRYIAIMMLSIFFIVGFDVSMNTNIANFLSHKFSISIESASIGISIYFAALMIGRFLGALLLRKVDPKIFMVISVILNIIGLLGMVLSNNLDLTRFMIFIAGLGFSNIFPLVFSFAVEHKPESANEISGLVILSVCGGAIIPPIMGILSDHLGINTVIYALIACILYVSYSAYYAIKK